MYYHGVLLIDPSDPTETQAQVPTKAFGRLLHSLTLGLASRQEEVETFGAVQVLQQLNRGLRNAGVDNVLRLAKDEVDIYVDDAGVQGDMQQAMAAFGTARRGAPMGLFEQLTLVCEHHDDVFGYLIEVRVRRRHPVGAAPIEIVVDGVLSDWKQRPGESRDGMLARLQSGFADEAGLDAFLDQREEHFRGFLKRLEAMLRSAMNIDTIDLRVERRILRAEEAVTDAWNHRGNRQAGDPALYGYHGFQGHLLYLHLWPDFLSGQGFHCRDCRVVDPKGTVLFEVGDEPVSTQGSGGFQPGEAFSLPEGAVAVGGIAGVAALAAANTDGATTGWLGGFFDGGDASGGGADAGCGSSCGGGCGGCGG